MFLWRLIVGQLVVIVRVGHVQIQKEEKMNSWLGGHRRLICLLGAQYNGWLWPELRFCVILFCLFFLLVCFSRDWFVSVVNVYKWETSSRSKVSHTDKHARLSKFSSGSYSRPSSPRPGILRSLFVQRLFFSRVYSAGTLIKVKRFENYFTIY